MKFEIDTGSAGRPRVTDYGPGHVTVAGIRHEANVIVMADRVIPGWGPSAAAGLAVRHLEELARLAPEIVLLGTGRRLVFPTGEIMEYLPRRGIGVEFMDTGAACRAYNFLLGDERRVAAALLID